MSTIQVIGIIVCPLFMSLCLGIAVGRRIKAVNDTRDEHADVLGIGGPGDIVIDHEGQA